MDAEIKIPSSEFLHLSEVRLVMLRLWMFCLLTGILQFRLLPSQFIQLHFLLLSSLETQSVDLVPNMPAEVIKHQNRTKVTILSGELEKFVLL